MKSRNGQLPIPIPSAIDHARWIGRFSRDVRQSIMALRDRQIISKNTLTEKSTAISQKVPWQPSFFTGGTTETPTYKCKFNLGTINNVPATNWNDDFTLSMAEDAYHFAVVTVTTSSGQVTGLTISIESSPPETDTISKGVPPVSHKIVLGAIGRTEAKMVETTNLNLNGSIVFLESKAAPAVGAEPYDRWYRWDHTSV